ncbi:hypothetical protein [Nonomuraea sp. CA-141351]|uniref:hypothetical protein n=1 Tax=Nonomuraea sp. CA-141351 TaxID=3239996 RepID=UPI003D94D23C
MSPGTDIELSRARLLGARNTFALSRDAIEAIRSATRFKVSYLDVCRGEVPIIFRHYAVVRTSKVSNKIKEVVHDKKTNEARIHERAVESVQEDQTDVWEVQGFLRDTPETPASWVYDNASAALSSFAYLLMNHLGISLQTDKTTDLSEVLTQMLFACGAETTDTVPRMPLDDNDVEAAELAALAAKAIEAKNTGTSTGTRKRIAVALYEHGETNIRRISSLTGLARDTVYKALQDEGIKR